MVDPGVPAPDWDELRPAVSATAPLGRAWAHTRALLFPFELRRWASLGFVAWLAALGEQFGRSSFQLPRKGWSPGDEQVVERAMAWVQANPETAVAMIAGMLALGFSFAAALLWVSSRAKLMFVEGIHLGDVQIAEAWSRWAPEASSLFRWRFALSALATAVLLVVTGLAGWVGYADVHAGTFGTGARTAIVIFLGGGLLVLPLQVAGVVIDDFVVPTMYLYREDVRGGWARVRGRLREQLGAVLVYYLVKLGLGAASLVTVFSLTLCTCCLTAIPYVGTVILLPMFMFLRCYELTFFEQLGPELRLFAPQAPPHERTEWDSGFAPPG
ncbi:MAG: hypothetical protein IT376_10475 [Polyangiaceae bacterium]|nr:hypothetical protein [Polyangiaceae bacterium]